MDEAQCLSACEENTANQPDFWEPRLENFLNCAADELCFNAESSCTISSSQFQM